MSGVDVQVFGAGPPVLFVNGLYNTAAAWQPYVNRLRDSHTVICFDFPNQGRNGGEHCGFVEQGLVLREVFAQVGFEAAETVAVGLSGGANLLRYDHVNGTAPSFKAMALLALNPGGLSQFFRQLHDSYLVVLEKYGIEAFWRASLHTFYSPGFFNAHRGIFEVLIETLCDGFSGDQDVARLTGLIKALFEDPTLERPSNRFTSPVLVLQGRQDVLIPADRMEAYVQSCAGPSLKYRCIDGGHSFPFESSEQVAEAIASFLAVLKTGVGTQAQHAHA